MRLSKPLAGILGWIVTGFTPLIILMLSVRLLITPAFPQVEYRLPGFPNDPYGFSRQERIRWSKPSINYLVNSEDIEYLSTLRFDDGGVVFNEQELSHMVDVKNVVTGMRIALVAAMMVLLVITGIAVHCGQKEQILFAYFRGGWTLIGLMATILFFVALSFSNLFTWFHQIFFESGTWQFYTSDTLIRLFPMRFWRDAFIFVGILSLVLAGLVILFSRRKNKPRESDLS